MNGYIKLMLKLAGSAFLLWFIIHKVKIEEIMKVIGSFKLSYLLIMILFMAIGLVITYASITTLLNSQIKFRFRKYFGSYLLSLAIGTISPARMGDFSLAFFIKDDIAIPKGLAIVFLNKAITILLMLMISAIGIFVLFSEQYALLLLILIILGIILACIFLKYSKKILLRILPIKNHMHIEDFYSTLSSLVHNNKDRIFISFIIMLLKFAIDSMLAYFLLAKLGVSTSYLFVLFVYSISVSVSLLPVTLNGIGLREIAVAYLFDLKGLNPAVGASVFFAIVMTYYLLTAFFPLFYSKKKRTESQKGISADLKSA